MKINEEVKYRLSLFDTAGQERFSSLPKQYYKNVDGILLLFDVNNPQSFEHISDWMKDIKEYSGKIDKEGNEIKNDVIIYLIGNKIDLEQKVSEEKRQDLINQLGIKYFEVSCKWNLNLEEVMARIILDCYHMNKNKKKTKKIKVKNISNNKQKKCC